MPTCSRCSKEIGLLGSFGFNQHTGRCRACEREVNDSLDRFRKAFVRYAQDGILSPDEWRKLTTGAAKRRIDMDEALAYVRGDAMNLLERTLAFASADGIITEDEEQAIVRVQADLAIPQALAQPVLDRLAYLKELTAIRQGHVPTIQPSIRLDSHEICHLETDATYHKVLTKSVSCLDGRLVATNKKLRFLSPTGGTEMGWKQIMRIDRQSGSVYLELSRKAGNGRYDVADPMRVEAILDTLTRIAKRELVMTAPANTSRHIPQHVKAAVWQRDQERCVQCGAHDYLEFDHIIPHSKGGANTVDNVQLLCRRCNLEKSDRM